MTTHAPRTPKNNANDDAWSDVTPLRLLDVAGNALAPVPMQDTQVLEALRLMRLSRSLDTVATKLQRLGKLGTYGPVHGQEASVVGSAMAFDPRRDWLIPAYREQPAMLHFGLPLDRLLAQYMGRIGHSRIPDDAHLLPRNQAVAAQLPHAVGLAWGLKLRKLRAVALVYLGDGATSEGDFHESANFAGVLGVPLVMFVQNNKYAISTPVAKQTAAPSIASRARGYGFPGWLVDGNDLFAVYAATSLAVRRGLEGAGPTLIESLTYRMGFHNTTDNPRAYRDDVEVTDAAADDPILRIERYLEHKGEWNDARADEMQRSVDQEIEQAIAVASSIPPPEAVEMFAHVYAEPPQRVREQREELERLRMKHLG